MANYVRNSGGIVTRFHSITTWWFGVVALNMYSTCTWMTAQTGQVSINVSISYPIVWHLLSPNLLYRISYGNGWKWIYTIHPKYMFNTLQTRGTRGVSLVSNFMDPMSAIPLWDCFKNIHMPHQQQWCFIIIKIYIYMICIQVPTNYIISTETGHVRASPTLRHTHIVFLDTYKYSFKICFSWLNTPPRFVG